MNRIAIYFGAWATLVAGAVIIRFTALAGTTSERRFPLAIALMLLTFVVLAGANIYESRRIALLGGLHGQDTFGYLRGWVKTAHVELAVHDSQVPSEAARQFRAFRVVSLYAFASLMVVIPVLVF
jgi:hypothetical protein